MTMRLRNVDVDPSSDVSGWPFEAVLAALDRGGLTEWRRLAAAVRDDPWGPLARKIEQALDVSEPYGVAPLMRAVIGRARERAAESERREVARLVAAAIERSGLGRAAFASAIGTSPSRLSTYESGRVMPSAALLLRMSRLADRARDAASGRG